VNGVRPPVLVYGETATARVRMRVWNQAEPQTGAAFAAASQSRRARGWRAPTIGPNDGILASLHTLRDRSRAQTRNDGYAKHALRALTTELIGTGIKPLSAARDPAFRRAVQALWLRWTDESDADGRLDFYGQQALAVHSWLESGEVFVRLRLRRPDDGLSVPLQVQVLEADLCPHTYTVSGPAARIRAGIEFSPIGRRLAYWFHPSRPGDLQDLDASTLVRVEADQVIHLYQPTRPGQLRGVPHLTAALVRLRELDTFDDATLLRQQLQNLFVAFLRRAATLGEGAPINPVTGVSIEEDAQGRALMGLEPGLFQELAPGEEVTFSDPPDAGQTYPDFMRQQLLGVAAATGVPYEVITGDLSQVNDRTVRVILNGFRRHLMQTQHQIIAYQLCRAVWQAWLQQVMLSGALPIPADAYTADPEPWAKVRWVPQGWPYLNPVQDVEAQKAAIRAGLTTRAAAVSEQGEDAEEIDAEQANDNARADALGLVYDSDARKTAGTGVAQPEPAPAEGEAAAARAAGPSPPLAITLTLPPPLARPVAIEKRVSYDAQGRVLSVQEHPVEGP
jgi:lambda family phage portal protein